MIRWLIVLALALLAPMAATAQGAGSAAKVDANGYYAEPYLTIEPGAHNATVRNFAVDRMGRYVVTGSDDKSLRIWSATDGRLLQTIRVPAGPGDIGKLFALAISPDGAVIAAGGITGTPASGGYSLYLFDRASGALIHRFANLPNPITDLQFSSDGLRLIATLGNTFGVRLYDVTRRLEIAADPSYGDSSFQTSVATDGRIATTSFDGNIRLYTPDLRLQKKIAAPGGKEPYGIAFSPDGAQIAIGYYDKAAVDVLDGRTLDQLYSADTTAIPYGELSSVVWTADGNSLVAGGRASDSQGRQFIRIWSQRGRGTFRDLALVRNSIYDIKSLSDGRIAVVTGDPIVMMLDTSAVPRWTVKPPILDMRLARLSLSRDGMKAEFNTLGLPRRLRFDARVRSLLTDAPIDAGLLTPQVEGLAIANWKNGKAPTISGKPITLLANELSRTLSVAPDNGSLVLGAEFTLRRYRADGALIWQFASPGVAWAVNQSGDGRIAVAAFGDGTIRWYTLADGVEQLALFVHADGERWVAWTPKGYYTASPGGEDLIRWVVNRGLDSAPQEYPVGAYRDKFYRPDVIATVLETLDINRAVQLADAARGRPSVAVSAAVVVQQAPPVVTILDPADGTFVDKSPIEVAYNVRGKPNERIKRLRVLIGGREVATRNDFTLPANGILTDQKIIVPVEGDRPQLAIYASNEFAESAPDTVQLIGSVGKDSYKPVLHVLAVGVSKFGKAPRLNLKFAAKDARDFAARMERQKGGIYRDVKLRVLEDEQATTRAIRSALFDIQRVMREKDVVVIFISSHAEKDATEALYFITHDTDVKGDIEMQETALEQSDVLKSVLSMGSRGTVLMFVDACKSGPAIPGRKGFPRDTDRMAIEYLASGNDVTLLNSSTSDQFSLEDDKSSNGRFTAALLLALDGKGKTSGDFLTAEDIGIYVKEKVSFESGGNQTPTFTKPNRNPSFAKIFALIK